MFARWQKTVEAIPVQFANVQAEFSAAIKYFFAQYQVATQGAVGLAELAALRGLDADAALHALLNVHGRVFKVVAQYRFDQFRRLCAHAQ